MQEYIFPEIACNRARCVVHFTHRVRQKRKEYPMKWTEDEMEYIEDMADAYGMDEETAYLLADLLGESELYDGFIAELEDWEEFDMFE